MKKRRIGRIGIVLALAVLLISGSCTGVGIFAVVAVSDKIDEGMLPEGISARPVVNIIPIPVPPFPYDDTEDYYFFSSGPGIWARNNVTNSLWKPIPLVAGGTAWDGVQSMAATDERIYLALYDVNGDNYTLGLFTLDSFDGTTAIFDDFNKRWTSDSNGFQTVRLFCPDPTGAVYINEMNHTGTYGSIDSEDNGFTDSTLYRFDNPNNDSDWGTVITPTQTDLNVPDGRYITGVADSGAQVFITATTNMFTSDGGILLDEDGDLFGDGSIDGSFVATTGITWLPRTLAVGVGAFIMSATALDSSTLPIFASDDLGVTWNRLSGTTTDFLTTNFIDVSSKTALRTVPEYLVLAGTSSYIDGSTSHSASGYNEIDVTDPDTSTWSVTTNWDDYSFALNTNYSVSDLAQATIIGMSIPEDGVYLYASTRNVGVWKIDMNTDKPSWTRE